MLFGTELSKREDLGDHVAKLESQLAGLEKIGLIVDNRISVAILVFSLTELEEYAATLVSVNTISSSVTTWNHVPLIQLENCR